MYKETLVKLVEEARTRAEEYISLNIQATLKGEEIVERYARLKTEHIPNCLHLFR